MKNILTALTMCLFVGQLQAGDLPGSKDPSFLKRFEGSSIVRYKASKYDTLDFSKADKDGKWTAPADTAEGKLVRVAYDIPGGQASSLEVYRNYENALKSDGFVILASLPVTVSDANFFSGQRGVSGLLYIGHQNDYYVYATKDDPSGKIHVSVLVVEMLGDAPALTLKNGDTAVFVDSIQEKPLGNKMVDGTSSDMARQIAATGSVNLYGIYFDTAKTDIKPQSKPTLDEVGKLMAGDATLKLKVVGHTDNVGTMEYNNDLSLRRAQSVVAALVHDYNITADRLSASGAGFSKPVASNDTEEGRAKNRRVELVKL